MRKHYQLQLWFWFETQTFLNSAVFNRKLNLFQSSLLALTVVFGIAIIALSSKIPWNCYTGPGACCPTIVPPQSNSALGGLNQVVTQNGQSVIPGNVVVNGHLMQLVPVSQQAFQIQQQPVPMTTESTNSGFNNQAASFSQPPDYQEVQQQNKHINTVIKSWK